MTDQKTTKCARIPCRCAVPQDEESCGKACRDAGSWCNLYKAEPTALRAEHTQQQPHARPRIDWKASRTMRGTMISAAAASAHSRRPINRSIGTNPKVEVKSRTCPSSHLVGNGC